MEITIADASSSNEAAHLQQKLKSLSTELVTLRNRLHVPASTTTNEHDLDTTPQVPPHREAAARNNNNYMNDPILPYPNKPLPPQPTSTSTLNTNLSGSGESGGSNQGYYENQSFQKGKQSVFLK